MPANEIRISTTPAVESNDSTQISTTAIFMNEDNSIIAIHELVRGQFTCSCEGL